MGLWAIFKENRPWGFFDRWAEEKAHTAIAAGTYLMDFTACDAGEAWVLEAVSAYNDTRAVRVIITVFTAGGVDVSLLDQDTPGAGERACWSGRVTLKATDYVRLYFADTVIDDVLTATVWGYKMQV